MALIGQTSRRREPGQAGAALFPIHHTNIRGAGPIHARGKVIVRGTGRVARA